MGRKIEKSIVFGASGGIGEALFHAIPATQKLGYSRRAGDFDLTDEVSIKALAARTPKDQDLIIIATGALELDGVGPEKSIAAIDPSAMANQFAINAIGPALMLKHFAGHLAKDRRSVFALLSARVGSIGDNRLGGWISYRAAKAALNQIVQTASIEMKRTHRHSICVGIHPGTVATDLTQRYARNHPTVTPQVAAQNILHVLDVRTPADSGRLFDWKGDIVTP